MKHIIRKWTSMVWVGLGLITALLNSCSDMERDFEGEALVSYPDITVTGFSPSEGTSGTYVTINGTNFGDYAEAAHIYFNGIEATNITNYSDTQITVRVPEDASTGPVSLNVWTHSQTTSNDFTVLAGAELVSIAPTSGYGGDIVTITGSGFGDDISNVSVYFYNNILANIVSITDTQIEVEVPTDAQTGPITVEVGVQQLIGPEFSASGAAPPGKYIFEFDDPNDLQWFAAQNSTFTVTDGKLVVTFDPVQFTGTNKRRSDLQYIINGALNGVVKDPWIYTSDYPILAIKYTKPATGNLKPDMTGGDLGNNTYQTDFVSSNVYYYDLSTHFSSSPMSLSTFQFKIADITSAETGYEVDWIGTFADVNELADYIN